jgi:hypothetical protein
MFGDHFMLLPFLVGAGVGILALTFHVKLPVDKVPRWPHPNSLNEDVFKDKNGRCFKFGAEMVNCEGELAKKEGLKNYPYQV